MWVTLATAGFFGIIVLIMVLRAEKSVANAMLAVITLMAIGVTSAATLRGFGPDNRSASGETRSPPPVNAALPALSCIDDLAGEAGRRLARRRCSVLPKRLPRRCPMRRLKSRG